MTANTAPVEGFADFELADYVCGDCLDTKHSHAPLSGECDSPAHCSACGVPLECELTPDGVDYVKDNVAGCCRELWPVLFADYLT